MKLSNRSYFAAKPGALTVKHKNSSAVATLYTSTTGHLAAAGFSGKRDVADFNFRFRNEAERETRIKNHFAQVQAREAYKVLKRQEAKKGRGLEVGDFLVSTWGYEQTNVDFYKVTKLVGKTMVELQRVGAEVDRREGNGMSGYKVPTTNPYRGADPIRKVAANGKVKITSYASAYVWDGKPVFFSEWH